MFRSDKNKPSLTGFGLPNPAAYEIGSLESRAAARAMLDAKLNVDQRQRFRLLVEQIGQPLNLKISTCACSVWPDGTVFESGELVGSHLDEAQQNQLDKFVRMFPVDGKKRTFAETGCSL
jgi:hypothetical protein